MGAPIDAEKELKEALDQRDEVIESLVEKARQELASLESRARDLRRLIARAQGVPPSELTLHEAMAQVLESADGDEMTAKEIAERVDRLGLYRKRDGTPVDAAQVHARARNYGNLFDKSSQGIWIRHKYTVGDLPSHGSYEARRVTVTDRVSADEMTLEVRVSYTALALEPGMDIKRLATQKARDFVARSGFRAGEKVELLLTSHGWVENEELPPDE